MTYFRQCFQHCSTIVKYPSVSLFLSCPPAAKFQQPSRQHVGKTTASLGIISGLKKRFKNVGFIKPVGQQHEKTASGILVDKARRAGVSELQLGSLAVLWTRTLLPPWDIWRTQYRVFHQLAPVFSLPLGAISKYNYIFRLGLRFSPISLFFPCFQSFFPPP